MPTPTIPAGKLFMNATLYTGNGSTQTITNGVAGQSFQPDLVWSKNRSNARSHALVNSVAGATLQLQSNTTAAEFTGGFASLNSNGFTVNNNFNENNTGETYVAWQWKAGGAATTIAVGQYSTSPNVPSIASSVSANTTSGFSVVTYTGNATSGATVGHGLGVAPSFIIAKNRSSGVTDWPTFHVSTGNNGGCTLNETAAKATNSTWWNDTTPSSSVVTLGSGSQTNGSTNLQVLYCFAPIAGYSAFGSYTGNGSADGPFVYTGFRPRFLMIKRTTGTPTNWYMYDSLRSPFNATVAELYPNLSNAEANGSNDFDFLSNGFKTRNTADAGINGSGETFIYMAFAENPFKYANAR
jgi:hypothetical protein